MQILPLVEFASCGLVLSAIAWLRFLYGAPLPARDWEVRHIIPFLSALIIVGSIIMGIQHPMPINQPDTHRLDAGIILGLHVVSAALVVWLVIEVGRYRTRSRNVSHRNQSYSRIPPPQRRSKRGKGKYRAW